MTYQRLYPVLIRESSDGDDDHRHDLCLLLIGKTGSGKSATGNTIFNDRVFASEMSSSSVTRTCQTHTGAVNNRRVTVIDTPDFIYSTHTDLDSDSELKKALELCSAGAHVILLLLSLSTFTEQEMDFTGWFEDTFGVDALRFTLVLFTHAGQRHMRTLAEMIRRNTQLSTFINRCGQRYHEFNIKAPANSRQVTELMEKIDTLVSENTHSCYTLDMMLETERRREERERRAEEEKNAEEERKEREHKMTLERVRRETETRVRRDIEQEKQKRAEEEKRREEEKREHQTEMERARRETEIRVREECEQEKLDKVGKSGKPIKAKYFCVIILFAVVSGGLSASRKDSSHGWMFIKGFFTGGSAATAGVFTGFLWRLMLKSQFVRICPFTLNNQNNYNQIFLKTLGIMCGLLNGLATGHILGENLPVTALAGLAGALTSIK